MTRRYLAMLVGLVSGIAAITSNLDKIISLFQNPPPQNEQGKTVIIGNTINNSPGGSQHIGNNFYNSTHTSPSVKKQ